MKVRDQADAYPWTCVLRGHRWFHYPGTQGWYRYRECRRCSHVLAPFQRDRKVGA